MDQDSLKIEEHKEDIVNSIEEPISDNVITNMLDRFEGMALLAKSKIEKK